MIASSRNPNRWLNLTAIYATPLGTAIATAAHLRLEYMDKNSKFGSMYGLIASLSVAAGGRRLLPKVLFTKENSKTIIKQAIPLIIFSIGVGLQGAASVDTLFSLPWPAIYCPWYVWTGMGILRMKVGGGDEDAVGDFCQYVWDMFF